MDHIINGVLPNNEMQFLCNDQILFSLLQYYKRPILPVIANSTYYYEKSGNGIKLQVLNFDNDESIYDQLKLKYYKEILKADLMFNAKNKINQNIPIGLVISKEASSDQKYLMSVDNKSDRIFHHILVYGFHDDNQYFDIIDHDYYNSFNYKTNNLSYEYIEKLAFFLDTNEVNELMFMYHFKETGAYQENIEKISEKYIKQHIDAKSVFVNGIQYLHTYFMKIRLQLDTLNNLDEFEDMSKTFFEMVNQKKYIQYTLNQLFDKETLHKQIKLVIDDLLFIAVMLEKIFLIKQIKKEKKDKISFAFERIINEEKNILETICSNQVI